MAALNMVETTEIVTTFITINITYKESAISSGLKNIPMEFIYSIKLL